MPDGYDDIDRQDLEKYEQLSDDEVALLAQGGDGQALVYLLDKYKNFVRARARSYFLIGADHVICRCLADAGSLRDLSLQILDGMLLFLYFLHKLIAHDTTPSELE